MQKKLVLLLLIHTLMGTAQEFVEIQGKIETTSLSSDAIHIINKTSEKGTISNQEGIFFIKVAQGDTLVFSSIQHQVKEHVVTDSDLKANQIMISLEPSVNHLEEVVVRQYSLTGTLEEDLDKIPTYTQNLPFWSAAEIDGFKKIWKDDAQSNVKNLVLEDNTQETPIDFIAIGKLLAEIMNIKTKTKFVDPSYTITDFYDEKFVVDILEIPKTSYYDFIDFVDEDSRTSSFFETI